MFCSNCGKEIKEQVNFCKYCGIRIIKFRKQIDIKSDEVNSGKNSSPEMLNTAITLTVLFPGLGHLYIKAKNAKKLMIFTLFYYLGAIGIIFMLVALKFDMSATVYLRLLIIVTFYLAFWSYAIKNLKNKYEQIYILKETLPVEMLKEEKLYEFFDIKYEKENARLYLTNRRLLLLTNKNKLSIELNKIKTIEKGLNWGGGFSYDIKIKIILQDNNYLAFCATSIDGIIKKLKNASGIKIPKR